MTDSEKLPSGRTRIDYCEMRDIVKQFPGVLASDHIDFDVRSGEVHALLGENGAGKSTLMKILYGLYQPDQGEILLNDKTVHIASPTDAINLGINMIHQHFMLVETLTVAENVALGLPSSRGALTDMDAVTARINELADIYGLQVEPEAYIWQLSVGQQQRVEIIKALYRGAALLILDEPTAVLTPQEVEELFVIMRQMVKDGHALIFISHKLHEVIEISNRVTVLRDGQKIGTRSTADTNKADLANWMVGREVGLTLDRGTKKFGDALLIIENISAQSDWGTPALRDLSLKVHSGEILGLAGVSGNGQVELAEIINGLRPAIQGKVILENEDVTGQPTESLIDKTLSYVPEERMREGIIKEFTVAENFILRDHNKPPFSKSGFLKLKLVSQHSDELIKTFNVKTPSNETRIKHLSGGNIQKLVLARELSRKPRVLIAAQPTRGLDISATEYVHKLLLEQRNEGTAILLISEDLDEILALSDRIAVIYEGQIMGEVASDQATSEQLGLLMAGVNETAN